MYFQIHRYPYFTSFIEHIEAKLLGATSLYCSRCWIWCSEQNYETIIDTHERTPLITYSTYLKEQKKAYKQNPFLPQNWFYEEDSDIYLCPNNPKISLRNYNVRTDRYGFTRYLKYYESKDCSFCSLSANCTLAKKESNRILQKNSSWSILKPT